MAKAIAAKAWSGSRGTVENASRSSGTVSAAVAISAEMATAAFNDQFPLARQKGPSPRTA